MRKSNITQKRKENQSTIIHHKIWKWSTIIDHPMMFRFWKQNIIQWSKIVTNDLLHLLFWLFCIFFSHISNIAGRKCNEVQSLSKYQGEFQIFYAISTQMMQLTICLVVLQIMFVFVADCYFFFSPITFTGQKKRPTMNDDNEQHLRTWGKFCFSKLFLFKHCSNTLFDASAVFVCFVVDICFNYLLTNWICRKTKRKKSTNDDNE